ncbi:MAG: glycosyltransferase [Ilumatobacter sp.]|uniref:glycosyltransferase n=1 Tax=Ilumatobacter sp. TaxID=1967498 RepID=UPI003299513F
MIEFSDNMRQLVASSVGVVSMAGYNTVVEELASGTPSMLVPRTTPRLEQDIRARRLGPHTNLERCPLGRLTPARLAAFVERASRGRVVSELDLGGVERVASLLPGTPAEPKEPAGV